MNLLGDARTDAEARIEAVIRRMPAWHGRQVRYRPVSGGISNANWRVEVAGEPRAFFVKVPGQGTEMFIDRQTAHDASRKAAATGYGAPVVAFLEDSGVEIFEFIDGWRTTTNLDFLDRDIRHNAVSALKAFNDQTPLAQTKTVFDMIDEHHRQVQALHARTPADHAWLDLQIGRARAALEASGMDLVPCMNDTLAGNFMVNDRRAIRLVDFEYASNNDRHYELALWFGEMFFPPDIERELLEDYFGRVTPGTWARVQIHKALADIKWSTWAMVQQAVSQIDFDYFKYGSWKHMRARAVIHDPQWESWLQQV